MASYAVNDAAIEHARALIEARQYVLDSDWGDVQPDAAAQNAYLENHSWDDYAGWHLGLTEGANDAWKPKAAETARMVCRTSTLSSAAAAGSAGATESSS